MENLTIRMHNKYKRRSYIIKMFFLLLFRGDNKVSTHTWIEEEEDPYFFNFIKIMEFSSEIIILY